MDRAQVSEWLGRYVKAWKSYDRALIGELFVEDAHYRYHPYDDPVTGRDAIVDPWFEDPDEPGTFEASYEPVAVEGDIAVAVGTSSYKDSTGAIDRVYDNAFVMTFASDGRCREFTEWYMKRPSSA
jgi:hypothetical protein